MQVSFIQHSTMEPEKSTVMLEARIETRAKAFNSPGGTTTVPDCGLPVGLVGTNRAAINASCNPPDALEIAYPGVCVCRGEPQASGTAIPGTGPAVDFGRF